MIDADSPEFWSQLFANTLRATGETLYMVGVTMLITAILGTAIGVLLVVTERGGILEAPFGQRWLGRGLNVVLGFVVNVLRSVPFIILMIALIPFTYLLLGTSFGNAGATVPLAFAAVPFFARIVEIGIREVPSGLVEAAESLGATRWHLLSKVLLPEALPAIILGFTTTVVSIINYSAIAGVVGAGGLGNLAIMYGYQRYSWQYIVVVVVVLVVLVQLLQSAGGRLAKRLSHR